MHIENPRMLDDGENGFDLLHFSSLTTEFQMYFTAKTMIYLVLPPKAEEG